jgi:hypothetical protein
MQIDAAWSPPFAHHDVYTNILLNREENYKPGWRKIGCSGIFHPAIKPGAPKWELLGGDDLKWFPGGAESAGRT